MTAPTTEPVSWHILQSVAQLFAQMTVANGYYNNATVILDNTAVTDNDLFTDGSTGETTATLRIVETTSQTPRSGTGSREVAIDVAIECYIKAGSTTAQQGAHRVRDDVMRCIPGKVSGLGMTGLKVTSRNILQRPQGSPYVVVQILLIASTTERTALNTTP